ncbi:MAG TPA: DUF1501 domain-containing protein [Tepidisphaeraceae bacterium]|jgi:uncharacterized protein (DUF1501 family)
MSDKNLHSRRIFLQSSMALMSIGVTVPTFIDSTVWAADNPLDGARLGKESGKDGRILVVVQLSGGNDGLNTVVPFADDVYHKARPAIGKRADDVLKLNDYLGLHPNLAPMKALFDDGMMSVVQGVGYPNPNRSHFRSMDIWQSAVPDKEQVSNGWLGRYFDNTCTGEDPHSGVCIGETAPLAMRGDRITPLSFERPETYRYNGSEKELYNELNKPRLVAAEDPKPAAAGKRKPAAVTPGSQLDFLTRTAMDARVSSDRILDIVGKYQTTAAYPGGEYGGGLRTIAAMIRGGLPTRVYYVSLGGFDTHANQAGRHDRLMAELAQGVGAFWQDMKEQKNDDRVTMMCFSEFGRRVQQNASQGTDHGAAAPLFLLGKSIRKKAGIIGAHPSLTNLDNGDLRFNVDFRNVYATLLEQWLGTASKPVLGQQFKTLPIFA